MAVTWLTYGALVRNTRWWRDVEIEFRITDCFLLSPLFVLRRWRRYNNSARLPNIIPVARYNFTFAISHFGNWISLQSAIRRIYFLDHQRRCSTPRVYPRPVGGAAVLVRWGGPSSELAGNWTAAGRGNKSPCSIPIDRLLWKIDATTNINIAA